MKVAYFAKEDLNELVVEINEFIESLEVVNISHQVLVDASDRMIVYTAMILYKE